MSFKKIFGWLSRKMDSESLCPDKVVLVSLVMAFIGANSEHSSGIIATGRVYVENS